MKTIVTFNAGNSNLASLPKMAKRWITSFPFWLKWKLTRLAIWYVVYSKRNSKYVQYAKNEFDVVFPRWKTDEMQALMQNQVVELLSVLATHGDSGFSIGYKRNLFDKLSRFTPLGPLTMNDDEFCLTGDGEMYYNSRNSKVFKNLHGQVSYVNSLKFKVTSNIKEDGVVVPVNHKDDYLTHAFILQPDGRIYFMRKGFLKNPKEINELMSKEFIYDAVEIEYPEQWYIAICKEEDVKEYLNHFDVSKDYELIEKEISYCNNHFRSEIISRINTVGRHMYGSDFSLKF